MGQLPAGLNCSGIMKTTIANCNGNMTCYSAPNSSPNSSINSTALGNTTTPNTVGNMIVSRIQNNTQSSINTTKNQTRPLASAAKLYAIPDTVATAYDHKWQRAQILYGFNNLRTLAAGADSSLITCINELVKDNNTEPWCDTNLSYDYSQHNFKQANVTALATQYLEAKGILTKNDVNTFNNNTNSAAGENQSTTSRTNLTTTSMTTPR